MHLVIAQELLSLGPINALETSVSEKRRYSAILNADRPSLSIIRENITNCDIVYPSFNERSDVMARPEVSQAHESCSDFHNS